MKKIATKYHFYEHKLFLDTENFYQIQVESSFHKLKLVLDAESRI